MVLLSRTIHFNAAHRLFNPGKSEEWNRATYGDSANAAGILPAMGYGEAQIADLAETIAATPCDVVVVGTPIDLTRVVRLAKPTVRVRYELEEVVRGRLAQEVAKVVPVHAV
jgi:predicted GTPase